jgi:hypothetical protein
MSGFLPDLAAVPAVYTPAPEPARNLLHAPTCRSERRSDGLLELHCAGLLPADWTLNLARALAVRRASIRDGYARRTAPGIWLAQLGIEDGGRLRAPELRAMVTGAQPPLTSPEPRILDFELGRAPGHGGCLTLEVHAWDAVGLLAGVLGRARDAGLTAMELFLETEADCAFHHLALIGRDGAAPTRRQRRALRLGLSALLGGR